MTFAHREEESYQTLYSQRARPLMLAPAIEAQAQSRAKSATRRTTPRRLLVAVRRRNRTRPARISWRRRASEIGVVLVPRKGEDVGLGLGVIV